MSSAVLSPHQFSIVDIETTTQLHVNMQQIDKLQQQPFQHRPLHKKIRTNTVNTSQSLPTGYSKKVLMEPLWVAA
jgi:hypothetical protein